MVGRPDTVADTSPVSLGEYCARPHALISCSGDISGYVDRELAKAGRMRHVALAVPQFSSLPILLAGTNLLATVSDYVADAMVAQVGLRAELLPYDFPPFELAMVWRSSLDNGSCGALVAIAVRNADEGGG